MAGVETTVEAGHIDSSAQYPDKVSAYPPSVGDRVEEIRRRRDAAKSLGEKAEWCVELEEAIGGRPPTRGQGAR